MQHSSNAGLSLKKGKTIIRPASLEVACFKGDYVQVLLFARPVCSVHEPNV